MYTQTDIDNIIGCVCTVFNISIKTLKGKDRKRSLVSARRVTSVLLAKKFCVGVEKAGKYLNKDHSTIVFYRQNHDHLYKYDKDYQHYYDVCEQALGLADITVKEEKVVDYVDALLVRITQLTKERDNLKKVVIKLKEVVNA